MAYYNLNGEKITLSKDYPKVLRDSNRCIIYTDFNETLKIYKSEESMYNKLRIDVYHILKDIKCDNFIDIKDIYFLFYSKYLLSKKFENMRVQAYKAKYYNNDDTKLIERDIEYFFDNFNRLEKLFDLLSKEGIEVRDAHYLNLVLTQDDMVIIDPDNFHIKDKKKDLININRRTLILLLENIIIHELDHYDKKRIESLFHKDNMFHLRKPVDAYTLSKELSGTKKLIDYFN